MKYLAILLPLLTIGVLFATEPDNAHEGFGASAFESPWNHKDPKIIRYMPPAPFPSITKEIQYAIATDGNIDRPVTMHVTPVLVNARKPNDLTSYRWLEDWRMERQPQGGGERLRYNWVFNGADVRQWRIFLPPNHDAQGNQTRPSTYTVLFDWDISRSEFRFFNTPGQWNKLTIAKSLTIHPLGRIDLGEGFSVGRQRVNQPRQLTVGKDYIVEKNGKKYLRVNGKLGIPLESLE